MARVNLSAVLALVFAFSLVFVVERAPVANGRYLSSIWKPLLVAWYHQQWWSKLNLFDANGEPVDTAKKACGAFIETYSEQPLTADKLEPFVEKTFFRKQSSASNDPADSSKPYVFVCCHVIYGKKLLEEAKLKPTPDQLRFEQPPLLKKGQTCKRITEQFFNATSTAPRGAGKTKTSSSWLSFFS